MQTKYAVCNKKIATERPLVFAWPSSILREHGWSHQNIYNTVE